MTEGFEQNLERSMFGKNPEKSFIDKILARQDVEAIRDIIKKDRLTRQDMLEILYLLSGAESKLLNYGAWDRYVILKFFVWIREFVKVAEIMYDVRENIEKDLALEVKLAKVKDKSLLVDVDGVRKRTERLLDNNERLMEHNVKFLVDLYLNIGRTSLSLGGGGFLELLKNKYEIVYPAANNAVGGIGDQKKGLMRL